MLRHRKIKLNVRDIKKIIANSVCEKFGYKYMGETPFVIFEFFHDYSVYFELLNGFKGLLSYNNLIE
jgi:hypothetical protein